MKTPYRKVEIMTENEFAIEINTPEIYELVLMMDPLWKKVSYDDAKGSFAIVGYPVSGAVTIMSPLELADHWDKLTPMVSKAKIYRPVR
jgi:hypothetical protein